MMMEMENYIPCKSPLCMICVSPVKVTEVEVNEVIISKGVFLQGLEILCKSLNLEDDRFGREEEWTKVLGTGGSFVESVCCGKCGEVLRSLVELQELIRKTEVKLRESVIQLELSVVNSVGLAAEVEYCIGNCLSFREEVLKSYQERKGLTIEAAIPSLSSSVRRSKRKVKAGPLSVKRRLEANLKKEASIRFPQVKLEKLPAIITPSRTRRTLSCSNPAEVDDDDPGESHIPKVNEGNGKERDCRKPMYKYRGSLDQFDQRRKRGRPRTRPRQDIKTKRPKGRPRIREPKPKRSVGRPRKDWSKELGLDPDQNIRTDENSVLDLQPESGPSAEPSKISPDPKIMNTKGQGKANPSESEGEEHLPEPDLQSASDSDNDSFSEEKVKLSTSTSRKRLSTSPEKRDRRIRKLDDPYNDRRSCRKVDKLLNDHGCYYLKPILVLSPSLLLFFNCKILMEEDRLLCRHPDCDFEVKFDYFTISTFYAFRGIRYHIKHEHRANQFKDKDASNSSNKPEGLHCCAYCDLLFERRFFLVQHIKISHPSVEPFPSLCEICGRSLPHSELLDHIYSHKSEDERSVAMGLQSASQSRPGKTKDPTLPLEFPCVKCEQVFKDYTQIRLHLQTHIPIELRRQWQCDMCAEKLSSLNTLRSHMQRVHFRDEQPMPFVCKICGQKFMHYNREKYEDHVRSHTGELPFQCHQCGKGFRSKVLLRRHERLHLDTQIPCEYCSKVYKSILYLRNHHKKHHPELVPQRQKKLHGNKPVELRPDYHGPKLMYPCEPCGKVYTFKSQLIPHLKHAHKMFFEKSSDYPNMLLLEDDVKIKNSRNRRPRLKAASSSSTVIDNE